MGRFTSGTALACALISLSVFPSCGSSNPNRVVANQVPGSISLTPSPNVSLELGKTQVFTATARNSGGATLTETFSYVSSNPTTLTVANNGIACAGTWDSLTTPTTCTPGSTGTTQVTAEAGGVSSPPVTVFVHQHVTSVVISKVPGQQPTLSTQCFSKGAPSGPESTVYQAFAFSGNTDVTSSVGPFTWQAINSTGQTTAAVSLSSLAAGSTQCPSGGENTCLNQQRATANSPGASSFFASANGVNSPSQQFITCPVQRISISALGNPATSFNVNTSTSTTLNATVTDILGMTLTGVPLTWNSSNPVSVKASGASSTVFGSVGTVSAAAVGAGSVTASCTPPTCNGGITPSMPIYPEQAISFTVHSATAPTAPTVLVTSTGCNPPGNSTNQTCITRVVPVTRTSSTAEFSVGTPISLPFAPNSLQFDPQGTSAYAGINSLSFGTQAAMVVSGANTGQIANVAGRILATSPDGSTAIFSDTADSPNRVFICQSCSSATARTISTFLLNGATAAAFSVDDITGGFKAYVVADQPCPGKAAPGCLLVFSKVDSPKIVGLGAPATDVTFIGNGTLGYIAGGDPAGAAFLPTCDDPAAAGSIGAVPLPSQLIRPLPDGQSAVALNPPSVQTVTATITSPVMGPAAAGLSGCPAPRGFLDIANNLGPASNLGVSSFTPTQFFLSPDGSTAYILGETGSGASSARLPFVLAFNLVTQTTADISLSDNAIPLSASISPGGDVLFVGADDGSLHVINTATQLDTQQIALPFSQSSLCVGPGNPPTPVETTMTITAASQSGSQTAFTYTSLTGPALQVGGTVVIHGMAHPTNNGTFTIAGLVDGTFTVTNPDGVNAGSQTGSGMAGIICNPDLVTVRP